MNLSEIINTQNANIQISISANDLKEFAENIVKQTIEQTKEEKREKLIPRKELLKQFSAATLWRWQKQEMLIPVCIGGKTFFKQSDLEAINIQIPNNDENKN